MMNTEYLIKQFLEDYNHKLSYNTLRGYKTALKQVFAFSRKSHEELTKQDIRHWLFSLEEEGCKPNTINLKIKALKLFFTYCMEEKYRSDNPVKSIPYSKVEDTLPYYLTTEQLVQLRNAFKGNLQMRAVIEVLYSTGIRISELAQLKLNEINWAERMILISDGKGKKERIVFFTRECEERLKAYLTTRSDNLPFVFINQSETTTIGTRTVVRWFRVYRRGLDFYVSPHTLRHTFAAHLAMKGMPIVTIQTLLGHDDPRTSQTYSRLLTQAQKDIYDQWV